MELKECLEFVQQLPHRGCGTLYEKRFAQILQGRYKELGYQSKLQDFRIVKHSWFVYFMDFLLFAISSSFAFYGLNLFALIFLTIAFVHFFGRPVNFIFIYRWLFGAGSQNLISEDLKQTKTFNKTLVIVAHYDTGKVIIGAKVFGKLFKLLSGKKNIETSDYVGMKLPKLLQTPAIITYTIVIGILLSVILNLINYNYYYIFACYSIFWSVMHMIFVIHVMISPYVPGASDNGAAVATTLRLAEYFKDNYLKNTRLLFLNSGSEENRGTHKGAGFFVESLSDEEKKETYFFNLETLGSKNLICTTGESDNTSGVHVSDKRALKILEDFIGENEIYKRQIKLTYLPLASDACAIDKSGGRMITTFFSMTDNGMSPYYHTMNDTIENINFDTLERAESFSKDFIEYFDQATF